MFKSALHMISNSLNTDKTVNISLQCENQVLLLACIRKGISQCIGSPFYRSTGALLQPTLRAGNHYLGVKDRRVQVQNRKKSLFFK